MTLIFPHVPKCGGTSIAVQLEKSPNLKVHFDYSVPPGPHPLHIEAEQRRNAECALLDFSPLDMIYGHFPIKRYDHPRYDYVVLVRDPLDRAFSQYNYLIQRHLQSTQIDFRAARMADKLLSGRNSFADWMRASFPRGIYAMYLDYWPASRFKLIGVVERYPEFCAKLGELSKIELDAGVRERSSGGHEHAPELSASVRSEVDEMMSADYAWYREFVKAAV